MSDLMQPFNERNKEIKKRVRAAANKRPKIVPEKPPTDLENMYRRPEPNPFTRDWEDGFNDGWDKSPFEVRNMNYADGYRWGQVAFVEDKQLMDSVGSSNA